MKARCSSKLSYGTSKKLADLPITIEGSLWFPEVLLLPIQVTSSLCSLKPLRDFLVEAIDFWWINFNVLIDIVYLLRRIFSTNITKLTHIFLRYTMSGWELLIWEGQLANSIADQTIWCWQRSFRNQKCIKMNCFFSNER